MCFTHHNYCGDTGCSFRPSLIRLFRQASSHKALMRSPVRLKSLVVGSSPVHLMSLGTGEFIMPSNKMDSSLASASSQRVVINTSTASLNPSLELTSLPPVEQSMSTGSTEEGDSFVLAIDWNDDAFNRVDESFEDPFLEPKEGRFDRRRKALQDRDPSEHRDDDSILRLGPKLSQTLDNDRLDSSPTRSSGPSGRPPLLVAASPSPSGRTSRSFNTKSLGSFRFPETSLRDALSAGTPPSSARSLGSFQFPFALEIPKRPAFDETDGLSVSVRSEDDGPVRSIAPSISTSSMLSSSTTKSKQRVKAEHERTYWNALVQDRICSYGNDTFQTAAALMDLGNAHMNAHEYVEAEQAFQQAHHIFYKYRKPLGMAHALDRVGLACSRQGNAVKTTDRALQYLSKAFEIRHAELGPWHVDTVDTLNHLATVHLQANHLHEARRCFWEVFWVRKAIFGAGHPGVAVSAHDLANAFLKLGALEDAGNFFNIAMEIYDKMELTNENPAVKRLSRDMKRLERLKQSAGQS